MRGKHDASTKTAASAMSEVASAELTCYGVFRKLEPDTDNNDDVSGGGVRVTAGRPPPPLPAAAAASFSPQQPSFAFGTVAAENDADDYSDFDRGTYTVYDRCSDCGGTTATAITRTTTTTTTTAASTAGGLSYSEDGLSDFVVWDDRFDCPATAAVVQDITTGDLRNVVGGAAGVPFSHTPMGSTTKLVGIDANSDDSSKVRTLSSRLVFK